MRGSSTSVAAMTLLFCSATKIGINVGVLVVFETTKSAGPVFVVVVFFLVVVVFSGTSTAGSVGKSTTTALVEGAVGSSIETSLVGSVMANVSVGVGSTQMVS